MPHLTNPGLEKPFYSRQYPELTVATGWEPWWCEGCPIPPEWNPVPGAVMKRPEFKPANPLQEECPPVQYKNRVYHGCNAQQWFTFYGVSRAGIYQTITGLSPGSTYRLCFYGQIWTAEGERGCIRRDASMKCVEYGDMWTSDMEYNAWFITGVDLTGGTNWQSPNVAWKRREIGFGEGVYDTWRRICMKFVAQGESATWFIGGYNKYPKPHNNWYADNTSIVLVS